MKHAHYHKDVSGLDRIDIYRVLKLYDVTDPCLQHAAKKILVAGGRGSKDIAKDVQEAIDTLTRWQEMQREDGGSDSQGGGWIEWNGGGCPVNAKTFVRIRLRSGMEQSAPAGFYNWGNTQSNSDIIAYRVLEPAKC